MRQDAIRDLAVAVTLPHQLGPISLARWEMLIRLARSADVLGKIGIGFEAHGLLASVPEQPRRHLASAALIARRQAREVRTEVRHIEAALLFAQSEFILLKGAAYALAGLRAGQGRMMSDIDILVPRDRLPFVESALMRHGWSSTVKSAYDQRYYRQWMHEIPPMRHVHRSTTIDVHHAILPLTSASHPSSALLWDASRSLGNDAKTRVLDDVDMLLHSASHLFHDGELEHGFRSLVDLDALLRELGERPGFWRRIVPRAIALELIRPLFYALRYSSKLLHTPVPDSVWSELSQTPGASPGRLLLIWMDALFERALMPHHQMVQDRWTPAALWLLFVRGHWLRMPPWLLAIHLTRKAFANKPVPETPPP
jgi:Uncharacterised nucleotidyltransferase